MQSANNKNIHDVLLQYWAYDKFRPLQEDIINAVLQGKDTLALLPTGGGKSICFQVPAMAMDGLCLVISPLIALMKDQVDGLRRKGITAFAIYAGMNRQEVIRILELSANSNCKFLYVSPERLETALFLEYLPALPVNLIAVDEAHCISQWGYDFRPPYLRIAQLRNELPGRPVLALTASATPDVQKDICEKLQFPELNIFQKSFERSNLSYSIFSSHTKIDKLVDILTKVQGTAIVYCKSRRHTQEVASLLQLHGINADYYHAGLSREERQKRQEAWIQNKVRCIVCTNAFGMGIDKPDVRIVAHYDAPDCLENYYQEAGRAGRDGEKSYAVLLYNDAELEELKQTLQERFPDLNTIRMVYQSIANYLQLSAGSGEGEYFPFDISDFGRRFKIDLFTAMYCMKALEQEEYLSFNEQVFVPSKIRFICNKELLYDFEHNNHSFEPVLNHLLRSYEGIFDHNTMVYERSVAYHLRIQVDEVKQLLTQLDRYQVIRYEPQKDTPQVYFIHARIPAESVIINQQLYNFRKQRAEQRLQNFITYIHDNSRCRSSFIGDYFGDKDLKDCGICDNCLDKKKRELTPQEFEHIQGKIYEALQQSLSATELLQQLRPIHKDKIWQVLFFLQSEGILLQTEDGKIMKRKR